MTDSGTRSVERELTVHASVEDVWRALTDAAELTRWFPLDASVEPGLDGSIRLSWGEGAEGTAKITGWEPGRLIRWEERYGGLVMAVEFRIEARSGEVVIRLVNSGFGTGEEWDEHFHMVEGGWSYFLNHLRRYLERWHGRPRTIVYERRLLPIARAEAYARLTGRDGLAAVGTLDGVRAGDSYEVRTSAGEALSGEVIAANPGYQLGLTIGEDALLFVEIEPAEQGCRPSLWLSLHGNADAHAHARSLGRMYANALGVEPGATVGLSS